jgi:hypothetical protein
MVAGFALRLAKELARPGGLATGLGVRCAGRLVRASRRWGQRERQRACTERENVMMLHIVSGFE